MKVGTLLGWALLCTAPPVEMAAQTVVGRVVDARTAAPVIEARVNLLHGELVVATASTDNTGRFRFIDLMRGSSYALKVTRIGYRELLTPRFELRGTGEFNLELEPVAVEIDPIVITASRLRQRAREAAASISVISRAEIEHRPTTTTADHVRNLQGVDLISAGLIQHNIVARGFNNVASGAMLLMTDNRYSGVPSLRLNTYYLLPIGGDDLEQVEVVRGPAAALYGPNSASGVMHFITRSPFATPRSSVSVSLGARSIRQLTLRHSAVWHDRLGVKLSADYLEGDDWPHVDTRERVNRTLSLAAGADPDTLRIGLRDEHIERLTADVRADMRLTERSILTVSGGLARAINTIDLTEIGAAQVRNWTYSYLQGQFRQDRLFAQAFINSSDAGDTYLLRTGQSIVDNSNVIVAQLQHGVDVGRLGALLYGVDYQRTNPRTEGTINGRNESDDTFTELGLYLRTELDVSNRINLIAAARIDNHSRLDKPIVSPRAAVVVQPSERHTFRFTYNRAFTTPSTNNLFLDIVADSLNPLPFAIRGSGVPRGGFTYPRSCGGLCMRSPFNAAANGGSGEFLPIDGTIVWDGLVAALLPLGIDLTAIPAPNAGQVGSALGMLNPATSTFDLVMGIEDIADTRSKITNSLEVGYRGAVGRATLVALDLWRTRINDFLGPLRFESPNVFLEQTDLEAYLANFMTPSNAATVAAIASRTPVGTVTPLEAESPTDLLLTYRNFGTVTLYGIDLGIMTYLSTRVMLKGTYSWTSNDFFANVGGFTDIALNAPRNKASLAGTYHAADAGVTFELAARYVAGFPVASGVFIGEVDSYGLLDANLSFRLPFGRDVTLAFSGRNLLGTMHRQFVGAPEIGRLILGRMKASI